MAFDEFEEESLRGIDQELTRAFDGLRAPSRLAPSVMNRVRMRPLTRLPEILDGIAWVGILSLAAGLVFFVVSK